VVSVSLIYLDTARLGRACPSAFRTQLDFNRLSADDPSMYSEDFLRDGSRVWSRQQIAAALDDAIAEISPADNQGANNQ